MKVIRYNVKIFFCGCLLRQTNSLFYNNNDCFCVFLKIDLSGLQCQHSSHSFIAGSAATALQRGSAVEGPSIRISLWLQCQHSSHSFIGGSAATAIQRGSAFDPEQP